MGAEIERSLRGSCDIRRYHRLRVRGIRSMEDKQERREECPQEELPRRTTMVRPRGALIHFYLSLVTEESSTRCFPH